MSSSLQTKFTFIILIKTFAFLTICVSFSTNPVVRKTITLRSLHLLCKEFSVNICNTMLTQAVSLLLDVITLSFLITC